MSTQSLKQRVNEFFARVRNIGLFGGKSLGKIDTINGVQWSPGHELRTGVPIQFVGWTFLKRRNSVELPTSIVLRNDHHQVLGTFHRDQRIDVQQSFDMQDALNSGFNAHFYGTSLSGEFDICATFANGRKLWLGKLRLKADS